MTRKPLRERATAAELRTAAAVLTHEARALDRRLSTDADENHRRAARSAAHRRIAEFLEEEANRHD